jgi:hypothetical protein
MCSITVSRTALSSAVKRALSRSSFALMAQLSKRRSLLVVPMVDHCRGEESTPGTWLAVDYTNVWTAYEAPISLPNGVHSLYFTYVGEGRASLASFSLG